MYFIPGTPLIVCSSGVVTADSTVCAFAPIYTLVTITCGGANSGNCAMGSVGIAIAPPSTISSAHTVANTGLSMKKSTNTFSLAPDLDSPNCISGNQCAAPDLLSAGAAGCSITGIPSCKNCVPDVMMCSPPCNPLSTG